MATNVSTALPDLSLEAKAILTVNALDAGAVITSMVIHFTQELPTDAVELEPHILGYGAWVAPPTADVA